MKIRMAHKVSVRYSFLKSVLHVPLPSAAVCVLQASAYASETGVLTEAMIDEKVDDALRSHSKKVVWQEDQTLYSYQSSKKEQPTHSRKGDSMAIPKGPAGAS